MLEFQIKINFSRNLGFLFNRWDKLLNAFKGSIFSVKVMDDNTSEKTSSTPSNISIRK